MARSQSYPTAIYATSGSHYSVGIASNTSPGVTIFKNEALIIWCGTGGHVQTVLQEYVGYQGTVNTTSIPCSSGGGRISVAVLNGTTAYAIGQPLNNGTYNEFTMLSSSDGINWTSYQASVTYGGSPDGTYAEGFGLAEFTTGGTQELALIYASTSASGGGPSVATSTNGTDFTWQTTVSSDPMYDETSGWDQSPAALYWTTAEGAPSNALYVTYFTTGAEPVTAYSTDGVTWSSHVSSAAILDRDAMLFAHDRALWWGGQSYYSEHNIWLAGSYDGVNFGNGDEASAYNMGGVTPTSPSAVELEGDFFVVFQGSNGDLYYSYTSN
jgi:hypothetical protein